MFVYTFQYVLNVCELLAIFHMFMTFDQRSKEDDWMIHCLVFCAIAYD